MTLQLRHNDYSLDADEELVQSTFAAFFSKEVPTERVRRAEPLGFDSELWTELTMLGAASMGLPVEDGGGGASLVDLVLVAEEFGRAIAPCPLIEHIVTSRLVANAGAGDDLAVPSAISEGIHILTLALQSTHRASRQLIPAGAITRSVVALDGDELVLLTAPELPAHVVNQGNLPLAWWDVDAKDLDRAVLATGPEARLCFDCGVREWKLLTAAALVGMGDAALRLGVEFAKVRRTLGVPIGALQGVAFPLADAQILLSGAKNLTRKAAWMLDREPECRPELVAMAFVYALRAANAAATISAHVQGGMGVSIESDITLYFRRAKAWGLLAGNPTSDIVAIGDHVVAAIQHAQEGEREFR